MSAGDPPVAGARRLDGFQDMNFFGDTDAATRLTRLKEQLAGVAGQDLAQQPAAAEHADRRRTRRALTEDEVARLLKAARLRPIAELGRRGVRKPRAERKGRSTWNKAELTYATLEAAHARGRKLLADKPDRLAELDLLGQERELMYKTMVLTGLRKGELASLTVGQVYLDAQPPFAELLAKDEKAGRGAMIPLRADLVEDLRDYLARRLEWTQEKASRTRGAAPITLPASSRLFTVPRDFIKIFDRDLVTAGIAKRDERDRVVDIHALRHTFGTYLSKAGVTPRVAMAAMRHSSLDLRTTNPIESIFATVRLRTNAAKRFKKTKSGVYLMHQVIDRLSKNWRRPRSAHLCPTVPLPMSSKSKQSKVA
jgi:integrase